MNDSDRKDPPLSIGVSFESIGRRLGGLRYRVHAGTFATFVKMSRNLRKGRHFWRFHPSPGNIPQLSPQ